MTTFLAVAEGLGMAATWSAAGLIIYGAVFLLTTWIKKRRTR